MKYNYQLFQVKRDMTREFGFTGLAILQHRGLIEPHRYTGNATIPHSHAYMQTYEGEVEAETIDQALETLFQHYSMSVGDIVVIDNTNYFCDSFGWEEIEINFEVSV